MKRMKKVLALLLALTAVAMLFSGGVSAADIPAEGENKALCLKTGWHLYQDPNNKGEEKEWYRGFMGEGKTIDIPYESTTENYISTMWLGKEFEPDFKVGAGERVVIDLEGILYYSKVWFNGNYCGENAGGYGKFSFDVTDYFRSGEKNLIAIRMYSPKGLDKYEGAKDSELPIWLGGFQRIKTPVYVRVVPDVHITDAYVNTVYQNGDVEVELTVNNISTRSANVTVNTSVNETGETSRLLSLSKSFRVAGGESKIRYRFHINDHKLWSPDAPNLYDVHLALTTAQKKTDYQTVSVGFKDLRVDNEGFFVLNGERIFLKCNHTTPYIMGSVDVGSDIARQLHQLDYFKSAGFNMVRFLAGPALPEQLDYCDRIGLLVYQENAMAWNQTDTEATPKLFAEELRQLALRDRNHASNAILGMLNETYGTEAANTSVRLQAAIDGPKTVREYDQDVLLLLSSGRWDYRNELGSACNPGSTEWKGYMGNEGGFAEKESLYESQFHSMGDLHYYPQLPYDKNVANVFASVNGKRASFISEAGAGSQPNIIADYWTNFHEQNRALETTVNTTELRQTQVWEALFTGYGLDRIYGTAEDVILESQRNSAEQRSLLVDYIRSNPKINGFSQTMGLDVGYRGEGILEGTTSHKDDLFDSIRASWSDLRWCINLKDYNLYNTDPLNLKIDLSNIGKLEKGREYTAHLSISHNGKTVWSKDVSLKDNGTFVVNALDEALDISSFASGEYRVSAVIYGAVSTSGSKSFWVTNKADMPSVGTVYAAGMEDDMKAMLESYGATVIEYTGQSVPAGSTILLAKAYSNTSKTVAAALEAAKNGAHVLGTNAHAYGDWGFSSMPLTNSGSVVKDDNWLYHSDSVIFSTALTQGLQNDCLMDQIYYEDIYTANYYSNIDKPDIVHSFRFFLGQTGGATEGELRSGLDCGTWYYGSGSFTACTFDLNNAVGSPTADRMLVNMANYKG